MTAFDPFGDVHVTLADGHVAVAEIRRPPNNFFDKKLIGSIADAFEALGKDDRCRAIVLCSEGRHFCAGADFSNRPAREDEPSLDTGHLYDEAVRLFATTTPVVAAIQGAAIGGGLGLALMPDFRIATPEARFSANFARLGFHHGFGLSVTLPRLVGQQRAAHLLYTGERVKGEAAGEMGLCDRVVPADELRDTALSLARDIAQSAPLAVESIRQTLRGQLAQEIRDATNRERAEQDRLQKTADFKEGTRAMAERRAPNFLGR